MGSCDEDDALSLLQPPIQLSHQPPNLGGAASLCSPPTNTPPQFAVANSFSDEHTTNPFVGNRGSDPKNRSRASNSRDGGAESVYKKARSGGGGEYRSECRKDREEWSDGAIESLLGAYGEKYLEVKRGNLRGRDWEEVASAVSERSSGNERSRKKSVEQCKNKVDNLKKRYKVERQRLMMGRGDGSSCASHWPWFQKIGQIVGSSGSIGKGGASGGCDEDSKTKRYTISTSSPVGLANNAKPKTLSNFKWRRVVFKVSGAALAGSGTEKIDPKVALLIAREVSMACCLGVQVAIVVGGRNFFCGESWIAATGLDRSTAYQIGMMATVMNSTLLQSALEKLGVQTRVQSAFPMQEIAEPYSKHRAIQHLEKGRVVIFGGIGAGTGNPLFTTDTAAALRASELNAGALLKGTNVDGVYDCHSQNNNVVLEHISFRELVSQGSTSMDMMAAALCEENGIPVVVFNLLEPGNISRALCGNPVGTLIDQSGRTG